MKLSLLHTGSGLSMGELVSVAREAESAGYHGLYLAEAWRSGFIAATAIAAATTRLMVGPYVLNAYGRSPLIAGMAAIDLQEFSHGRLMLGVGGGNKLINERWQGTPHVRVLTKMREYVTLLKQMGRTRLGQRVDFDGQVHSMHWPPSVEPWHEPFPVTLAAVFPSMMAVAAEVADRIGGGATLGVDYLREVLQPRAAEAAARVGRDPASLPWMTVGVLSMHEDRARARAAARSALCHFYAPLPHPYYEFTMREQGFSAAADACLLHMPAGRVAQAMEAIPDECIDRLTITGTPAECAARIAAYRGVVDELLLLNVGPSDAADALARQRPLMALPAMLGN